MRTDAPNIVESEHVHSEQVAEKEQAALRAETDASLAKQAAASKIQAALREAAAAEEQQKITEEALEHQAEIEAETRVEERKAAEVKSQVETVFNKDEMIDVISCTRGSRPQGSSYPLELHQVAVEDTSWSQEGCVYWNVASSPRSSGKCPVQVNQVSITETMLDEAREECNRLELRCRRIKEENRLSEAQLWSETEKRGQIAETFNMKNMEGTE